MAKKNLRRVQPYKRDKIRARLRAEGRPCWICEAFGRPAEIDYSLPHLHPGAFECDELIPVSRGGSPTEYSNLAATHRACNQWRSNRSVEEVLALARKNKHNTEKNISTSKTWLK